MKLERWLSLLGLLLSGTSGCASDRPDQPSPPGDGAARTDPWLTLPAVVAPDHELAAFENRQAQYEKICNTPRGDSFHRKLCQSEVRPEIPDLAALLRLLELDENRAFALSGNSTSLVATSVSAINPRVIVFPRVAGDLQPPSELVTLGFVRGEQFVEIASRDTARGEMNFYLFVFEQECSYSSGCGLSDLLTEKLEHGWTAYSVYGEEDLEKTSFDCLACHQPTGFGGKKILRMQELVSPWLHWFPQKFVQRTESDRVLLAHFSQAHAGESQYGGIALGTITGALDEGSGAQLEALIRAEGFAEQPNPFDSSIAAEAAGGQVSPSWQARFDVAMKGQAIAVPYPRVDVTDEAKRTLAVQSLQSVIKQTAPASSLVDVREVFSEDARQKLGFVPQPGADGRSVLVQMCSRCHDGRANPALTRSHFNVQKLDQMPRAEKDLAIERMQEARETRMPPWRVGNLTPDALRNAIEELRK